VLILKDATDELVLPIWIGAMEAMAISLALNKVDFPRPMTHDLLLLTVRGLGAKVGRVEVVRMLEGTFYAEIVAEQSGEERRIDSRPSDAIALAVRAEAPIFVADEVLESAGVRSLEGYESVLKTEEAEKWTEVLEDFDPEGGYKM
jgi:bifunctional DNase/RNase